MLSFQKQDFFPYFFWQADQIERKRLVSKIFVIKKVGSEIKSEI